MCIKEVINEYLAANDIPGTAGADGSVSAYIVPQQGMRFSFLRLRFNTAKQLEIILTLPVNCALDEIAAVSRAMPDINASMKEGSCFETDAITGAIRCRRICDAPADAAALGGLVCECLSDIDLHGDTILGTIHEVRSAAEKAAREKKKKESAQKKYDEAGLFEKFLYFIGVVNDPRKT